jgi:hypothetical protein
MERCLMLDVASPFILRPIGIALGGLLFFEIAKRSWRVDPVPHAFEVRSKAIGREWPAANAPPRPVRVPRPSRPVEAQRILAGSARGWSILSGNVNPTRYEARVTVSIRVIGEDDAVVLASGQADVELDEMARVTSWGGTAAGELLGRSLILGPPLSPDVGYEKQFDAIIDPEKMVDPSVAGI